MDVPLATHIAFPTQGAYPTAAVPSAGGFLADGEASSLGELPRHQDMSSGPRGPASECNASVGGASNRDGARVQAGLERRIAWLEEDVALLHRRQREEFEKSISTAAAVSSSNGIAAGWLEERVAQFDAAMRMMQDTLVNVSQHMEVELTGLSQHLEEFRRSSESRLCALEETVVNERHERVEHIQAFSQEVTHNLQVLIARMDETLAARGNSGSFQSLGRSVTAEERLRSVMRRVDEQLASGVAEIEDGLAAAAFASGASSQPSWSHGCGDMPHGGLQQDGRLSLAHPSIEEDADHLIRSWDRLRKENELLKASLGQSGMVPVGAQVLMTPVPVPAGIGHPIVQVRRVQSSVLVSTMQRGPSLAMSPNGASRQHALPMTPAVVRMPGQ